MKTITFNKDGLEIPIRFEVEENTIWMTQNEMATLFSTSQPNISKRIKLLGDFLKENASTHNSELYVAKDGKRRKMSIYNLDVVRLIGLKINPILTNEFVSWCNEQLNGGNNQLIPIGSNIIRFTDKDLSLNVNVSPKEQTVWLTQSDMALLFDTTQPNISLHITNIIKDDELVDSSVHKESLYTALDGKDYKVSWYNLDMILAVGYRIKTNKAIKFRRWATDVLKQFLIKGYVIDKKRSLVTNENYINLINTVNSIDRRVSILENEKNINLPKHKIITDGEILDAVTFVRGIIESANKSIVIIDPWCDFITMSLLNYKKDNVLLYIITSVGHKISEKVLNRFPKLKESYMYITEENHARYLIIDDKVFYRFGPSINHIGDKFDQANKEEDIEIQEVIRRRVSKYIDTSLPIDKAIMK